MRFILIALTFLIHSKVMASDLYSTNNHNGKSCDYLSTELKKLFRKNTKNPILFFVHGRGKHPEKGLDYLPEFEQRYGLDILMFHWDSWINAISRPEQNAIDAASRLAHCFEEIQEFKDEHPSLFKKRPVHFMAHSMGNIVFKSLIENHQFEAKKFLFESVTLNASDVPYDEHKKWIEKIKLAPNIYITFNSNDAVLIGSKFIDYKDGDFFSGRRLGRSNTSQIDRRELAKNAYYLDFSQLTFGGHQHFLDDGKNSKAPLTSIFQDIFHGAQSFQAEFSRNSKNGILEFTKKK